jgi:nicotinamidase-related amidase
MMTQNCVAFTAVSPEAARYRVSVLSDCTTTVDEAIHGFALHALSTRVEIGPAA